MLLFIHYAMALKIYQMMIFYVIIAQIIIKNMIVVKFVAYIAFLKRKLIKNDFILIVLFFIIWVYYKIII